MRPIVDRQKPVKTLPSLAVGKNEMCHNVLKESVVLCLLSLLTVVFCQKV